MTHPSILLATVLAFLFLIIVLIRTRGKTKHACDELETALPSSEGDHPDEIIAIRRAEIGDAYTDARDVLLNETTLDSNTTKNPTNEQLAFYLVAEKKQPYGGYEFLQTVLSLQLRHGEMDIFHRYSENHPEKPVLFSMASAEAPGTFDINHMGGFSSRGLCFLMDVNQHNNADAFECLIRTIDQLAAELGGTVCDSNKRPCLLYTSPSPRDS